MFGALFDFGGKPVAAAPPRPDGDDVEITILGPGGEVALVHDRRRARSGGRPDAVRLERLDDRLWLIGEARLDGGETLRAALRAAGVPRAAEAAPTLLCLLAYERWGERCLERLAGDFAFVIWDAGRGALFAARDQMGKRCLYHARSGSLGAIGDCLDWVADHAAPGREPDDDWIADFLILNACREPHRTALREVARLPPAHAMRWSRAGVDCRRYWRLEIGEPLRLARHGDYLERFRELAAAAVADRLPAGPVGLSMSGGLDSTTLAAFAARAKQPGEVFAFCEHYETLMRIEEDRFAAMAAGKLGIDLQIVPFDDRAYDPHWQARDIQAPEPTILVLNAHCLRTLHRSLADRAGIWFEGEGPDSALLFERDAYFSWLRRRGEWGRLAQALATYVRVKGVGGWRETLLRHLGPTAAPAAAAPDIPPWIAPELVSRVRLQQRIDDLGTGGEPNHPWRPRAVAAATSSIWQAHFSDFAFLETLSPLEWRHPFVDLRVLTFMLSLPPVPWGWKKALLREAMAGLLPEPVLRRPKTSLPVFPTVAGCARTGAPPLLAPAATGRYVDPGRLPGTTADPSDVFQSLNAFVLDHWLATRRGAARRPVYKAGTVS